MRMEPSRSDWYLSWIVVIKFCESKTMRLVKVLWQDRGVEEATWEREDTMRSNYPFLFEE